MTSDPAYDAISKAKRQEQSGNPMGAVQTLEDYLATDPHNISPRIELARIYIYSTNNRQYGISQLNIVLDMDPDNIDALKASTTVKMTDKRLNKDTDAEYQRLVSLVAKRKDPEEFASVCAAYAVFLRKQMVQFVKAGEYYEKAITACPDKYEYHQDYAVLLLNDLKDYQRAKTELEEILRLKPNNLSAKSNYDTLMKTRFDKNGNVKKSLKDRIRGH